MADLLSLHRDLVAMIHANGEADVQPITRMILDGLDERGRHFLGLIRKAERDIAAGYERGATIMFELAGGEPAVRKIIADARWHRSHPLRKIPALRPVVWEAAE